LKASVIDLGFNSVKMVNYLISEAGEYRAFRQVSFKVRLGEGLNETGFLQPEPINRTLQSLEILNDFVQLDSIDLVIPVATSAVREAANAAEFLSQVASITGFRFRVLSQEEEGLLSYAGATGFESFPDTLFFDLGGGSLEIIRAVGFHVLKTLSLPLGALRLSYAYGKGDGTFDRRGLQLMKDRLLSLLPDREELRVTGKTKLVGVGGGVRALARLDQELTGYPFHKIHNYALNYESVDAASRILFKMSPGELSELSTVSNRFNTIAAAAYIIKNLMRTMAFDELLVSNRGLREGTLSISLRNPKSPLSGTVSTSQIESFTRSKSSSIYQNPLSVAQFLRARLVDDRQAQILSEAHRLQRGLPSSSNPLALFFWVFGEDCHLNHSDQLIVALIAVNLQNQRVAGFLLDDYRSYVDRKDRKSLSRLTWLFGLTELIEETGATFKMQRRKNGLKMTFSSTGRSLPESLLRSRADSVGQAFNLHVDASFVPSMTRPLVELAR
jgi:exopolyphosphatase/guanosine-5'-triphosphate,3'-diphosphate pyrophosphatase